MSASKILLRNLVFTVYIGQLLYKFVGFYDCECS